MSNLPLNIDIQQIFLHLLNFTLLLAGLYFLLYEPVKTFMGKRTAYYEDLDRQATEKLEEARRVRRTYEDKLDEAEEEIRRQSEEAQKAAAEQAQLQLQDAKEEAAHILAKARAGPQRGQGPDLGYGGRGGGAAGAGQYLRGLRPIFSGGWRG